MGDSSLLAELQALHTPEYRKGVFYGNSVVMMPGHDTYYPPRPGTEEFRQAMRKQLETPFCAHCRTEYPCATAQIFLNAHTPGEGAGSAQARADALRDSMSLLREIDELGRRRSWRDRLTAIWSD